MKQIKPSLSITAPYLSIVIPAYNEAQRLPTTLTAINSFLIEQGWLATTEVIVVDDGSQDTTCAVTISFQDNWPQLLCLPLAHAGKGAAVRAGMLHATGRFIFFCDADLSMPIDEITRFLPPDGPSTDIVIGSREMPDSRRYAEPIYRHIMGRIFNHLVQLLILPGIHDTQCGFKLMTYDAAHTLCSKQLLDGMSFDVELLALARLHGYTMSEIAIDWYHEQNSRVRPIVDTLDMVRSLFILRHRLGQQRPALPVFTKRRHRPRRTIALTTMQHL